MLLAVWTPCAIGATPSGTCIIFTLSNRLHSLIGACVVRIILCFWVFFCAKYTGVGGILKSWLPSLVTQFSPLSLSSLCSLSLSLTLSLSLSLFSLFSSLPPLSLPFFFLLSCSHVDLAGWDRGEC